MSHVSRCVCVRVSLLLRFCVWVLMCTCVCESVCASLCVSVCFWCACMFGDFAGAAHPYAHKFYKRVCEQRGGSRLQQTHRRRINVSTTEAWALPKAVLVRKRIRHPEEEGGHTNINHVNITSPGSHDATSILVSL